MTIAEIHLTELQRQQLLDVLERRFKKMTDRALLELERLTRHPVDLIGFQAKTENLVLAKQAMRKSEEKDPEDVIDAIFSTPLSRREFFAYSFSGLLTLLLGVTGYGYIQNNEAIDDFHLDLDNLLQTISALQVTTYDCKVIMSDFQSFYQPTLNSITPLKEHISKVKSLYSQLDETELSIVDEILSIIGALGWVTDREKYSQPLTTMFEIVKSTLNTILLAETALHTLSYWFSDQPNDGINRRLFSPTGLVFQIIDNDIKSMVDGIQSKLHAL